jgi:ATPase subunit of ABC transporter with duplicated ATPase domains
VVVDADLTVRAGDKVGLAGRNGAGKTSMLRVLAGVDEPAAGTITLRGRLGYLSQDPAVDGIADDTSALGRILSGRGMDAAMTDLEKLRVAMEGNPSEQAVRRYTRAEEQFRVEGGYAAEAECRRLAAGLGIGEDRLELPLRALSGGERRRVELARILYAGTDVLLLDEPTNHLDIDARDWMLGFLRSYRGALVVISHDLELLDDAITRVVHLERPGEEDEGRLTVYRGTWSEYLEARAADEARLAKEAAAQEREIQRLKTLADSMRGQTEKRARTAKSLDTRRARIEASRTDAPVKDRMLTVKFPEPPAPGRVVLEVSGLAQAYGGPPVFQDVEFIVGRGDRLLVMGLNGAGKTSLLRILAGITEPLRGEVQFGHNVSVGYYAQEHEGLVGSWSLLDHLRSAALGTDRELRSVLGTFGLSGEKAFQDAGTLSGGEKTKLALAQLVAGQHNLLLLDEPTNNLDPGSREATAVALSQWPGSMVIVSHDVDFVRRLRPERVLLMPDGDLDYWTDDYLDLVALS